MTLNCHCRISALEEDQQHEEEARTASAQNGDHEDHPGNEQESETEREEREVTEAAERKAEELGVDLDEVEGTGSSGRVVVGDVEDAAE